MSGSPGCRKTEARKEAVDTGGHSLAVTPSSVYLECKTGRVSHSRNCIERT